MRILTALAALLVCAAGQAQTVDICDRTPQVRDAILEALDADDCAAVDSERLAGVGSLSFGPGRVTALRAGDFDGLARLREMNLFRHRLTTLPAGVFDGLTSLERLELSRNELTTLAAGVFDGLTRLRELGLHGNRLTTLRAGVFDGLDSLRSLDLSLNRLTTLPAGVFDGLTRLRYLYLGDNQLTALPDGAFDVLTRLQSLDLGGNQLPTLPALPAAFDGLHFLSFGGNKLTTLPAGVFDGFTSLEYLLLGDNDLRTLPDGAFDVLTRLQSLDLGGNQLTTLPDGVFDGLASLRSLRLGANDLTTLPAGVFDGLASLESLFLNGNRLTALPAGVFDGLASLRELGLGTCRNSRRCISGTTGRNELTTLPAGVFDGLTSLRSLDLRGNRLTTLPAGVFDGLTSLSTLDLQENHLVGLTRDDPVFAGFSRHVDIRLGGQTKPPDTSETPSRSRLAAAVPLMLAASDSTRQGFVRVVSESGESGSVRVFAFHDSGHAPDPIKIQLGAGRVVHFNSNDLESGNATKGIEGVGSPAQGDWRLDVETDLAVRVLAFVRHGDGFLTAMHDVLPRDADGRLVAHTFNPGGNMNQASSLRLVNTGANDERVSIEGVDDQGGNAGPVTLTLPAGESRTLSAFDLENGAHGLTGTLGDGAGKWRLFITAGSSVVGMSLLESAGGQLTNISTAGVASDGQ